jgi:8-oxo-dGTP diphosphatase
LTTLDQDTPLKRIEVVAAVIESRGRILCVRRGPSPRPYISGKWEFPGGKVEHGEDQAAALAREIEEELRVAVRILDHLVTVEHVYPDFEIRMHAWLCSLTEPENEIEFTEHVDSCWAEPGSRAFADLDWAAADVPIVELLRERAGRS